MMKSFLSSFFGALLALIVFVFGGAFAFLVIMAALAASGEPRAVVENGSFLVFDLSVNISDAPEELDGAQMLGQFLGTRETATALQTRTVVTAIRRAARDSRIGGIYLTGQLTPFGYGSGYATLKEVREALLDFRKSGKPVLAFLDHTYMRDYYLSSAATDIAMDPFGTLLLPGFASRPIFFTGALEKFGVGVQVARVGRYKAAVEPFLLREMSDENRRQTQQLLDQIWQVYRGEVAAAREMTPAALQSLVDEAGMIPPDLAVQSGLIDRVAYVDEMLDELKGRAGLTRDGKTFKQIDLKSYAAAIRGRDRADGAVAVVYAEGVLVDGEGTPGDVGGARFARELRRYREDDQVKAIVLRVNSPGGSATASEAIQREIRLAQRQKPVVVSMGSLAASGGYWIAAFADRIFAHPNTITGSIGVFGLFPNVEVLAGNFGLTWDSVTTGRFADALTITRPKTEEEMAILQSYVEWIYGQFLQRVREARHLDGVPMEDIAEGRVWSGLDALELGLVDEFGGLSEAIAFAAKKAGLGSDFHVREFPREKDLVEALLGWIEEPRRRKASGAGGLGLIGRLEQELNLLNQWNDPRGVYARLPIDLRIR